MMDTKAYWRKYVKKHDLIKLKDYDELYTAKIQKILRRTILLFPLLVNEETGGIIAALEVDEEKDLCGRYAYCWPRDAVTISQALDMVGMYKDADNFYNIFLRKTQSQNGMWEQRFYTDGRLAPCWGYQIDETGSVVAGLYQHFKIKEFRLKERDINLLKDNLTMCENAIEFLKKYMDHLLSRGEEKEAEIDTKYSYLDRSQIYKHVSYDLWEMNEGVHLYSLSAIYAAFGAMELIYKELQKDSKKFRLPEDFNELAEYKELIKNLGRLYYRTSYGQNVLKHSLEVGHIAGMLAAELGANVYVAKRAGLLHDIGKAVDQTQEGTHIQLGVELASRYGEKPEVIHAIEAHHDDVTANTIEAVLVKLADAISAGRPGARRDTLEIYIKRLQKIEEIVNGYEGIKQSFAVQAGREVRVIVQSEMFDDLASQKLARDIAKKIEDELDYPGQIKVTVVREFRTTEIAK